jgi:type IV pilus assembly protein PilQ
MRTRSFQFALILLASAALLRSQPAPAAPAASAPAPAPAVKAAEPAAVTVQGTEPANASVSRTKDTLSVDFPDEDIRTILRNVADLFELNLVVPETMQGKTSIKLRDVTWRQIFEVVLTPIGYTYIEQGSIIKIVSLESLAQEPVNTEIFVFNYARASEILPILSSLVDTAAGGKIVVDNRSNSLVITERPSRLKRIRPIVTQLDKATEQVMIESKFVEVTTNDLKNIGVNWSSLNSYNVSAGPFTQNYSDGVTKTTSSNITANNTNVPFIQQQAALAGQVVGSSGPLVPAPSNQTAIDTGLNATPPRYITPVYDGFGGTSSDSATLGGNMARAFTSVFSADQFKLILSALQTQNMTKVISNPTIVTLNNTEAFINVGEEDPIPNYTYNQEHGSFEVSGFAYKPIGIILKVTPQVNASGFIKMTLEPEVSQKNGTVNFGGAAGAEIPIIATRKAKTQVSMKDGYTMAIGGLMRTQTTNSGTKVPVLGSIPVLGNLFKSHTKSKDINNLIIFITAKTISAQGSPAEEIISGEQLRGIEMRRDELPGYRGGPDPFLPPETPQAGEPK